jgi:5-formyltetrahydrofolate cyclo-ligase
MAHFAPLDDEKTALRRLALDRRDGLPAASRYAAANAVAARPLPVAATSSVVSGYIPIRSEFDPQPLMRRFAESGARLALPCVVARGAPLVMRAWRFGEPLVSGQWGLREPAADVPEVLPDILLVPLAAFDRAGQRIGYGAGYYDMTIARLRARKPVIAIGVAFAIQEVPRVPADERDARLDLVLTESEAIDLR